MRKSDRLRSLIDKCLAGGFLTEPEALSLSNVCDTKALVRGSSRLRDSGFANVVTYSRKVFIPLTKLCRDVCHYCTFAKTPRHVADPFMSVNEVLELCREAKDLGCKEALFTLGEKPELRYRVARETLSRLGFETTLDYVAHVAGRVLQETGLLPHINAGCMTAAEIKKLRSVSASMGIMLESASERLCHKGMPHHGSPDKQPVARLETIERAGEAGVPFTSGILIGIGETRRERIESLLLLRASHERHAHIQEIIIQNFRAKADTKMANAAEPDLDELVWTIAVARLIFGAEMSIQAPPNLSSGELQQIIDAGINDWGGVSPITPDFVNPEAPWPHVDQLAKESADRGKYLQERLSIYPEYAIRGERWLDDSIWPKVMKMTDAEGYPRVDSWLSGQSKQVPSRILLEIESSDVSEVSARLINIVDKAKRHKTLTEFEIIRLFQARGPEVKYVCQQADNLRDKVNGDSVAYVVNRNINYTNVCYFKCQFCAFSKGKRSENRRGRPYDLRDSEIARRAKEAWARGATEVCLQGGIHPRYTGKKYIDILKIVKAAVPSMHIHAFSPLEVWQGAATLGIDLRDFLCQLKAEGLHSLPGTAAEILDDDVRKVICPDKLDTSQWLQVIETAHQVGLKTTATIMFGHVDGIRHWARHLLRIRQLQMRTGGFTEMVPLPFVANEAPIYGKGKSRSGPTFREALLMHAVSRIVLFGAIDNIQASWVKMGDQGVSACLQSGANDIGGTLMNETITRSAGASHGEERTPEAFEDLIQSIGRTPKQRNTDYSTANSERYLKSHGAEQLTEVENSRIVKQHFKATRRDLIKHRYAAVVGD